MGRKKNKPSSASSTHPPKKHEPHNDAPENAPKRAVDAPRHANKTTDGGSEKPKPGSAADYAARSVDIAKAAQKADGTPTESIESAQQADGTLTESIESAQKADGTIEESIESAQKADGTPAESIESAQKADGTPAESIESAQKADGTPTESIESSQKADGTIEESIESSQKADGTPAESADTFVGAPNEVFDETESEDAMPSMEQDALSDTDFDAYDGAYFGRSSDQLSAAGRPLVTIKKRNLSPLRPPEEVEVEEIVFTQAVDGAGLGTGPFRLRAGVRDGGVMPLSLQISEMVYIRTFVIALLLIFLLFMTYYLSPVLTPILFSLGLAYLLNPLVLRMEKLGISRSAAISMFVLLLVVLLISVVLLFLPALSHSFDEFSRLMQQLPTALNKLKVWAEVNFKFHFPKNFTEAITQWGEQIQKYVPSMVKPLTQFFSSIFLSGVTLLIALFNFLFIPLFTFYFLKDYKQVEERVVKSIPPRMRGWALGRLREIDRMISGFIRGQITVSMIVGSCYMILLSAVQVPMAPVIALIGALINVVPYLGFFITYLIALTVALIQFQLQWQFFVVLIGMFAIHMCDVFVFTPKVVGEHTGMSELVVMIAILVGGKLFGIVGILLAVPMAAVVKVLLQEVMSRYEGSDFFRGQIEEEEAPPTS